MPCGAPLELVAPRSGSNAWSRRHRLAGLAMQYGSSLCGHDGDYTEVMRVGIVWVGSVLQDLARDAERMISGPAEQRFRSPMHSLVIAGCDFLINVCHPA